MSKGKQTMQKIVIKKPWGVEIKDYKAGDPIPAGVKFKIFDAKDTAKIEAYADSLDESATYQKKRFKEPYYMYKESVKTIKEAQERKKDYLAIVDRFRKDINKHIDKVERDIEKGSSISRTDQDEAQVLGTRFSAELLRYNLAVENKTLTEGRIARGYENLDAEEKAKHLLSHPTSKYMGDLKSDNITERAIRKAVKEMLGKPDKDDPQFIIDVNEEGEAPAVATSTANVANPELPLKMEEGEDELENSIKYQTSVAGGMGTDAENAESAKEHEDEVVMVKEHRSFRKFIKESK